MKIGIIGLGRMGGNIARRLMRAGHETVVFDRDEKAVAALVGDGATGASSLADMQGKLADPAIYWVMLPAGARRRELTALIATLRGALVAAAPDGGADPFVVLLGDGRGGFRPLDVRRSGISVLGDGRGAAAADFDADGRVDLAVSQNGTRTTLWRNRGGRAGLRVRLSAGPDNPLGIGARVRIVSRRGAVETSARYDPTLRAGLAFMNLHFPDVVATNMLTIDATDPKSGTAEFKAAGFIVRCTQD